MKKTIITITALASLTALAALMACSKQKNENPKLSGCVTCKTKYSIKDNSGVMNPYYEKDSVVCENYDEYEKLFTFSNRPYMSGTFEFAVTECK